VSERPDGDRIDRRITPLERAFQMARSGRFSKVADLIRSLEREGYSGSQVVGPVLRRQLFNLIKAARAERDARSDPF
jgi:hypothetical protein